MRISDWSSDVCSSDLVAAIAFDEGAVVLAIDILGDELRFLDDAVKLAMLADEGDERGKADALRRDPVRRILDRLGDMGASGAAHVPRSEGHTSELQSLMRISYAVFCLKKNIEHVENNGNTQTAEDILHQ